MILDRLLRRALEVGASDLHLKAGSPPIVRIHGRLEPLDGEVPMDGGAIDAIALALLSERQQERFALTQQADLAYGIEGFGRFRVNAFRQRGSTGMVIRLIPPVVHSIEELGLPPVLASIAAQERGLALVTGTAGSGKSTTLAALIDHINQLRAAHVITIEDPIEYLHTDQRAVINQREVGADTPSFADALRSALRPTGPGHTSSRAPSRKGRRNTACRASINRSSACTCKARSATTRRSAGRRVRTSSG